MADATLTFESSDIFEDPAPRMISGDPMKKGRDIARLRHSLDLTEQQVAEAAVVPFDEYHAIEQGAGVTRRGRYERIARVLRATLG